jgi:hypothetical protein
MSRHKHKNGTSQSKSNRSEEGFTFLEILVAMFLLALLGVVLWSGLRIAQGGIGTVGTVSSSTAKLLQLNRALRHYVEDVRFPFWEGDSEIQYGSESLEIPYYNAERDSRLVLTKETTGDGGRMRMTISIESDTGDEKGRLLTIGPFQSIDWSILEDDRGAPRGLRVEVVAEDGERFEPLVIVACFGGLPL